MDRDVLAGHESRIATTGTTRKGWMQLYRHILAGDAQVATVSFTDSYPILILPVHSLDVRL
jgi:hypothetical protein